MKANPCRKKRLFLIACKIVYAVTLILFSAGSVFALPNGQQVASGQASFNTQGNNLTITNSPNAIINWQGFSINNNEAVRFIQQYGSSAVLNRVIGQDPSRILGLLQSNGKVFLINPNGILFGQGARIDVNGLVASTLNLSNQDFLAGKYNFSAGAVAGAIENQGTITTPAGGKVFLIAPDIENSGIINSPQGDVTLAAGHSVYLVDSLDPDISVVVSAPANKAVNLGQIVAESGKVGIYGGLISQKGIINANSAVSEGGRIYLKATKAIELADTSVISADGTKGGQIIAMTAEDGQISGTLTGRGLLSAQGVGSIGGGGFIETSAAKVDLNGINVRTNGGNWLIDPLDFYITAGTGVQTISGIGASTLSTALGSGSVSITTNASTAGNGDIFVNGALNWGANTTLTLSAHRNIDVNANITATGASAGLMLYYGGASGTEPPAVDTGYTLNNGAKITLSGALPTLHIGNTVYTVINSLGGEGIETDGGNSLQGIAKTSYLIGNYALGSDINASDTSTWHSGNGFVPIGNSSHDFTGIFDGLGHTITGLHINRPTTDYVGLIGNNSGTVKNVGMVDVDITGRHNVGGLVGYNSGSDTEHNAYIYNSYSTGKVTGKGTGVSGGDVGGLVGDNDNYGIIDYSYSTAMVSGTVDIETSDVGGLVGENWGKIYSSYSTGTVSGTSAVGGLVGWNNGDISQAYSTGAVTGSTYVGGLVGENYSDGSSRPAQISNSYSMGAVTGSTYVGGLVGKNFKSSTGSATITKSYSTGAVSGPIDSDVGGLVGGNTGTVTYSYWDQDTSGQEDSAGGSWLTTATMMSLNPTNYYSGWNFSTLWNIVEDKSYPYLRWQFTGMPQIISGKVDVAGAGRTIQTAVNGSLLAAASTGANGFYYFALPSGSVSSGSSLLAYISGDAVKAASIYLSSGTHITDFSLYSDAVTASSGGIISNTAIGTAKGVLDPDSINIPYAVSGNNLTLSSGFNFTMNTGGNMTLNGLIDAGTGIVTLKSGGAIINGMGSARSITAASLFAEAVNGIGSGDPLMTGVSNLSAVNTTLNNIQIDNTGVLAVSRLSNGGTGNVILQNIGAITTTGELATNFQSGGKFSIIANSPLTIGLGGVSASGNILLEAAASGGTDDLTINGNIESTNGNITLKAGSSIIGREGRVSAPNGTIVWTDRLNDPGSSDTGDTGNATATTDTLIALKTTDGETIATVETTDEEDEELKKKKKEGGEQTNDDKKKEPKVKNYCN